MLQPTTLIQNHNSHFSAFYYGNRKTHQQLLIHRFCHIVTLTTFLILFLKLVAARWLPNPVKNRKVYK